MIDKHRRRKRKGTGAQETDGPKNRGRIVVIEKEKMLILSHQSGIDRYVLRKGK
jgi:hypothetical protein